MKDTVEVIREVGLKVGRETTKVIKEVLGDDIRYFDGITSISKLKIIAFANETSNGIKYSDICRKTGLAKPTATIAVNDLCRLGMVTKEVRGTVTETYILLTPLGEKFVNSYYEVVGRLNDIVLAGLNTQEIDFIDEYLDTLNNSF